ncbi:MAG: Peptide deformylase [candidate division WS2 bacterium]|nr:Peptide deformylase [Candidatus Lithacetigena glycinireducens]
MVKEIKTFDAPVLKKPAKRLQKITDEVLDIVSDMLDTLNENRGVGLAANQVNILKRIILVDEGEDVFCLINPRLVKAEGEEIATEGCLSFPKIIAEVKRAKKIKVKGQTLQGKNICKEIEGIVARIYQHEIDHLNGITFLERAEPGTIREMQVEEDVEQVQR